MDKPFDKASSQLGIGTASCRFADGAERTLLVTKLSPVDVFCTTLQRPALGTEFRISLQPFSCDPLNDLEALVVAEYLLPDDAGACGFRALFINLSDVKIDALRQTLETLHLTANPEDMGKSIERRRDPRVPANLPCQLQVGATSAVGEVVNVSMTGAMAVFAAKQNLQDVAKGQRLSLQFGLADKPALFTSDAVVAWCATGDFGSRLGVQYVDTEQPSIDNLNALILHLLDERFPI